MKLVKGFIETDIVGSVCKFEFEVEDDCTEDEIEGLARQAAFERIDWNYTVEQSED